MAIATPNFEQFSPTADDWDSYYTRFQCHCLAHEIPRERHVPLLLSCVGAQTFKLLKGLLAPENPTDKTLQEINACLSGHFTGQKSVQAERFKFRRLMQAEYETVAQYLARLRIAAMDCNFPDLNDALKDQFIQGLHNESWQKRLLHEDKTFQELIQIATGLESASRGAESMSAKAPNVNAMFTKSKPKSVALPNRQFKHYPRDPCGRCGGQNHFADDCKFKNAKCHNCGKTGHIQKACRSKSQKRNAPNSSFQARQGQFTYQQGNFNQKRGQFNHFQQRHQVDQIRADQNDGADYSAYGDVAGIQIANVNVNDMPVEAVAVNGKTLKMMVDSGAVDSFVDVETWKSLGKPTLQQCPKRYNTYGGFCLPTAGQFQATVSYKGQTKTLPLVVSKRPGSPLFGRTWLKAFHYQMQWTPIANISPSPPPSIGQLVADFPKLFDGTLGHCTSIKPKLHLKPNATPVFHKAMPVPFALKPKIEADLERQVSLGILEPVEVSEWASSCIPVSKPNGNVRLCGNYKPTVNPCLSITQYPLPRKEDLFACLAGGQRFSKLDMSEAYLQVELHEESKPVTVINTHKGLFKSNRLLYGLASAPAIFQQIMDQVVPKKPGVAVFIDDIIITGRTDEEHFNNLRAVFNALQAHGFRLRKEKCSLYQKSVKYLGFIVDRDGIHVDPANIAAIRDMPPPVDVPTLRSFLGTVNHYASFVEGLSAMANPMYRLLQNNVEWKWNRSCQASFAKVKAALTSAPFLTHFDPTKPVALSCDASSYGIGAVLFHIFADGSEHPISFASKTLTAAEKNYSQIEREGLALVYGVRKFHQYLYGRKFTLYTDHKPLVTIFGPKTGIPVMAASRLQRWAIILAAYQYDIKFVPTNRHANCDGMSRLPLKEDTQFDEQLEVINRNVNLVQEEVLHNQPVDSSLIKAETQKDPVMVAVSDAIVKGWKNTDDQILQEFEKRKNDLTLQNGCVLYGHRVVIPLKLRPRILEQLHSTHCGIVRMKAIARSYFWFPGLDKAIEEVAKRCSACQTTSAAPPSFPVPWSEPAKPWSRIHIDFAGPFRGRMWLIVVDAHSKWPEVLSMKTTTTAKTVKCLQQLFARFGIPDQLVSDNGPQFTSREFEEFCRFWGVTHTLTPPYHANSNGLAERFVRSFKSAMTEGKTGSNIDEAVSHFLITYRNCPHATTGKSPAMMMFNRNLKTRMDHLFPKQEKQTSFTQPQSFAKDELVWVRVFNRRFKFAPGVVVEALSPTTYKVNVSGHNCKRHLDQLKKRHEERPRFINSDEDLEGIPQVAGQQQTAGSTIPSGRVLRSNRRPTMRFGIDDYVSHR